MCDFRELGKLFALRGTPPARLREFLIVVLEELFTMAMRFMMMKIQMLMRMWNEHHVDADDHPDDGVYAGAVDHGSEDGDEDQVADVHVG